MGPRDGNNALIRKKKTQNTSLFLSLSLSPSLSLCAHTKEKGHVRILREGSHLKTRKWTLIDTQVCLHLDLEPPSLQN